MTVPFFIPAELLGAHVDALTPDEQHELLDKVRAIFTVVQDNQLQLRGPGLSGWPQLKGPDGKARTVVDALGGLVKKYSA